MIDNSNLETFEIIISAFLDTDKANRVQFFENTFLLGNVSIDMILKILFLTLSNVDIRFSSLDLT